MAKIKLYDYYDENLWMFCGIGMGNNSAEAVSLLIDNAVAAGEDIEVEINSGGGFVFDGWNIYNKLIEAKKTVKVKTVNSGLVASIASIIFLAGDDRESAKASLFMVHKPSVDLWCYGSMTSDDLKREADCLDQIQKVLVNIYVEATGLDEGAINDMVNAETWLTPSECLALGFINTLSGDENKASVSEQIMNSVFASAPQNIKLYANRIFNTIKTPEQMEKPIHEEVVTASKIQSMFNKFVKSLGLKQPKNASTVLKDGTTVYHSGELAVDTFVYSDEEMTMAVSDGTHTLSDDSTFVTVDGVVTEMNATQEGSDAENTVTVEALQAENEVLRAEINSLKAENATIIASLATANKTNKALLDQSSNYVPKERNTDFGKNKVTPDAPEPRFSNKRKRK